MDLFPLYNSIRIAILSAIVVFFIGMFFAYYVSKASKGIKAVCDCFFMLPLVLPPTVIGYLLLLLLGPSHALGKFFLLFNIRFTMVWIGSVFACVVVSFPLMYRAARASFESFDERVTDSALCLGVNKRHIFWDIRVPYCKTGLSAGAVLSFARSLGEYGASSMVSGYIPSKTATLSTTVYQMWQIGNNSGAAKYVVLNIVLSIIALTILNFVEKQR